MNIFTYGMGTLLGHANTSNNNDEKLKVEQQQIERHDNKNSTLATSDENSPVLSKNLKTLDFVNSDVILNKVMDNIKLKLGNMAEKSGAAGGASSASYLYTSVKYVLMPIILMFISVASPNCTVSLKAIITCFVILHIFIVLQPNTIFDEIIK